MSNDTYNVLTLIGIIVCIVLLLVLVMAPYRRR